MMRSRKEAVSVRKRADEPLSDLTPWSHQGHRGKMAAAWTQKGKKRFSAKDWRTFNTAFGRWVGDASVDVHTDLWAGRNTSTAVTMRR